MVAMAEVVVWVLLAAIFFWWFRRTSLYRSRRRSTGGVPGQFFGAHPTYYGQRANVPPLQPALPQEYDDGPSPQRRWWGRS